MAWRSVAAESDPSGEHDANGRSQLPTSVTQVVSIVLRFVWRCGCRFKLSIPLKPDCRSSTRARRTKRSFGLRYTRRMETQQRSLAHRKQDAAWHARLARLLTTSGRHAQAVAHYEAALKCYRQQTPASGNNSIAAELVKLQFQLAAVHARLRNRSQAMALYAQILQQSPQCAEAHVNMAAQLMITGSLEQALEHCTRAIALSPTFREAHYNMNVLLRRLGRQPHAVETYWAYLTEAIGLNVRPVPRHGGNNQNQPRPRRSSRHEDTPERTAERVSVVCVKWGTKYSAEYVNKLYLSVMRHVEQSDCLCVEVVCLTDDTTGILSAPNLHCVELGVEPEWTGWWYKARLFAPDIARHLRGKCVFMDLDTVIVGPLDAMLSLEIPSNTIALLSTDRMANERRQGGYNSSLMIWRNENDSDTWLSSIYTPLAQHFQCITDYIYKFDHWLEMVLADQVCLLDDLLPGQIVEYKSCVENGGALPADARLVCFPLQPKPHDPKCASWVSKHWQ